MDVPASVLVGLGGALGALARYGTTRLLDVGSFPYGTLAVNVLGSVAVGLLAFGGVGGDASLLLGVGACGAFTTFSSHAHDTVRLAEDGPSIRAGANVLGTLVAALGGLGLAWLLVG